MKKDSIEGSIWSLGFLVPGPLSKVALSNALDLGLYPTPNYPWGVGLNALGRGHYQNKGLGEVVVQALISIMPSTSGFSLHQILVNVVL